MKRQNFFDELKVVIQAELRLAFEEGYRKGKRDGKFFGETLKDEDGWIWDRVSRAFQAGVKEGRDE